MGGRKKQYIPKSFESTGEPRDTSANIYESMLCSAAYQDLTKNQRLLYVYMKAQYYGKRKPGRDNPDIEGLQWDDLSYFNLALAVKYGLYASGSRQQFYADIKAVEEHGFIKTVSKGRGNHTRSIYQFTGDWKTWGSSRN